MAEYDITFARSARKELEDLDTSLINRIFPKIKALSTEPHPTGCRKLQGEKHLWRIRSGDYRVIYAIDDHRQTVDVIAIRHRSAVYR